MKNKEFYFLAATAASEEELTCVEYVFDNLRGFIDCLENPVVQGKVLATRIRDVDKIKGNLALAQAYEMGRCI